MVNTTDIIIAQERAEHIDTLIAQLYDQLEGIVSDLQKEKWLGHSGYLLDQIRTIDHRRLVAKIPVTLPRQSFFGRLAVNLEGIVKNISAKQEQK